MAKEGPATGKRERISKAQQYTILEVLGASLVLGACVVLSIFLIKYIAYIVYSNTHNERTFGKPLRNIVN